MPDLRCVTGFMTPAMVENTGHGMLNGFSDPKDVHRIEAGYGCGNCCAIFDRFMLDCPICHQATHVTRQRESAPQEWLDHVKTRHADVQTYGPGEREPMPTPREGARSVDEFLRAVGADGDVDQVPLSKLRKRR